MYMYFDLQGNARVMSAFKHHPPSCVLYISYHCLLALLFPFTTIHDHT